MPSRELAPLLHLCPRAQQPMQLPGVDLAPGDAFVWSRIDGLTTLQQLADVLAMSPKDVFAVLRRLEDQGLIAWPGDAAPRATAKPGAAAEHPALSEPGDLDRAERLRILGMEQKLGRAPPWELLNIPTGAGAAEIKRAYFAASKAFHPDRFFGKNMGSFAARLQRIFEHIKAAQDGLLEEAAKRPVPAVAPPLAAPAAPKKAPAPPTPDTAALQSHREAIASARHASTQVVQAERSARRAAKIGDWTQARIWAERAVQAAPQRVDLRLLAAHVCEAAHDLAAARSHLHVAASLDRTNKDVKAFLARLPHGESNRH